MTTQTIVRRIGALLLAAVTLSAGYAVAGEPPHKLAPTFQGDLKGVKAPIKADYAASHPRLLFSAADIPAIKAAAKARPDLWANVMKHAKSLVAREVPDAKEVSSGAHYWRIEYVQSGAMAWLVTGDRQYFLAARNWMVAYCKGKIWGEGWGENVDLRAAWYLYHIAAAYDILRDEMTEDDRAIVRDGLADHARAIYEHIAKEYTKEIRYAQNHTYIPATGMVASALAVMDEVPEARKWIDAGYALLARSRYALGNDGYYYEGRGYWSYALHMHVRYADLMGRATGRAMHDLPALRLNWLYALHTTLPGFPWGYDMGDTNRWKGGRRDGSPTTSQHPHLWGSARALRSPELQLAGDFLNARGPELDYPAATLLWYDPTVQAAAIETIKPYHHFKDHDVVFWRSGWGEGDTCLMFRSGPAQGHAAARKTGVLTDWKMNSGHTHPDIGAFWLYAKGEYLVGDTGYTARKYTRDHNTLLVSGKGQGNDGSYWNDRGLPYAKFDKARIVESDLTDDYALVRGEFGSVYPDALGKLSLTRSVIATRRWVLLVDDLRAEKPQTLTWLCHTDNPFKAEGTAYVMAKGKARLAVLPLGKAAVAAKMAPTIVFAGTSPNRGKDVQRGHHLELSTTEAAKATRLVTLLVPLGADEALPEVTCDETGPSVLTVTIRPSGGKTETVTCNLKPSPKPGGNSSVTITAE